MLASLGESATLRNSVVEIVTHPSHYLAAAGNDLALLRLASAVDYAAFPHIRQGLRLSLRHHHRLGK